MSRSKPWIGKFSDVAAALIKVDADADEQGHFVLHLPSGFIEFMRSRNQVMITDDDFYELKGVKHSLHALMSQSEPDPPIQVFGEDC